MDVSKVNYIAVLAAAVSSFLIGGLWYSPVLFAHAWMREAGLAEERLRENVAQTFAAAFVLSLVVALNLAFFLGTDASLGWGAGAGALAGVGWAAASLGVVFVFERRSLTLMLIDGGYLAVSYTVMGVIIAALQ
ncbi:MAG: DUF1761 domain-containing protein [Kofleriaceae bacterium]